MTKHSEWKCDGPDCDETTDSPFGRYGTWIQVSVAFPVMPYEMTSPHGLVQERAELHFHDGECLKAWAERYYNREHS